MMSSINLPLNKKLVPLFRDPEISFCHCQTTLLTIQYLGDSFQIQFQIFSDKLSDLRILMISL